MGVLISKIAMIVETLNALLNGGLFSFVAETKKDALKKSRITKEPTPENLSIVTVLKYIIVTLGADYPTEVNKQREKEGMAKDFEAQGTYCVPVSENLIIFKHKERDSYYLRVYPNLAKSFLSVTKRYDKNGVEISQEQWVKIEAEYFPLKGDNKKQGTEKPIIVNNYKLENVKWLKHGKVFINELTTETITKLGIE